MIETVRKIDLMHRLFGMCEGQRCVDCNHFSRHFYGKTYFKCEIYGESASEATDWRMKYPACGLFNRDYIGRDIVRLIGRKGYRMETNEPIDGQVSFEEGE